MKNYLSIALMGIFFFTNTFAQEDIVAKFVARSHSFQGTTLPYRLFIPDNYDPAEKYPLVLALHGSGESGSDNLIHIRSYRLATVWADPANQAKYPCFVVAPQCPVNASWSGNVLDTANDIVESLMNEFLVDHNRLYVTGLSMGGFGTWDLITQFPNRFAAAVPMSSGWDPATAPSITGMPIWNFHGTLDDAVPVSYSRDMITALEQAGQTTVYTHCRFLDCSGLPDSLIARQVRSHANLLYTEYENGGHVIWDESYDYLYLLPWVFDKYKITPEAIALTNPAHHQVFIGTTAVTWNAINSADSVEIWFSPDAGNYWQLVSRAELNGGTYQWNTESFEDCSFGLLKVFLKNSEGFIYGQARSDYFTINNSVNGKPYVKILNEKFRTGQLFDQSAFELTLLIGDAETDPLNVKLFYSVDGGQIFSQFDSYTTLTDSVSQKRNVNLASLPNSNRAAIKIEVSDNNSSVSDRTFHFNKNTPRVAGPNASHITGSGGGTIAVNVIDPAQLTDHLYRVTFDALVGQKTYDVLDVERNVKVVEAAMQLDGVSEGPQFDGIRLVIKDLAQTEVDHENTKWEIGSSTLDVSIFVPTINLGNEMLHGFPQPSDYRMTIFDHVVDTSSTAYGAAASPMKFMVRNLTEDRDTEIIFLDNNGDQTISRFDEIFFVEPDEQNVLRLTWSINFTGSPNDTPPLPGDEFAFRTLKPLTSADIFEFRAVPTSVGDDGSAQLPGELTLFPNYPNPFNPATTIRYYLPKAEHVKIAIFDLLGRKVITLFEGRQTLGEHSLKWDGRNKQGSMVGGGIYFYKIAAGSKSITKKMLLLR